MEIVQRFYNWVELPKGVVAQKKLGLLVFGAVLMVQCSDNSFFSDVFLFEFSQTVALVKKSMLANVFSDALQSWVSQYGEFSQTVVAYHLSHKDRHLVLHSTELIYSWEPYAHTMLQTKIVFFSLV